MRSDELSVGGITCNDAANVISDHSALIFTAPISLQEQFRQRGL